MITKEEYAQRREKIYQSIDDNSVLILFAGVAPKKSADENYEFTVNRNFYYLTGITQESYILLAYKQNGIINEYLFILEENENIEKWTGKRLKVEEAKEISGLRNVLFLNQYHSELNLILTKQKSGIEELNNLYLDLEPQNLLDDFKTTADIGQELTLNYPRLTLKDIYRTIILKRMVKSPAEVNEIQEAINKTNMGLKAILKKIRPGLYEYQLSSLFYYTIQDYDHSELSFPTICASGVNATTLHYPFANSIIEDNDLVLFDLGSQNNFYCGDISRTYPASGSFTEKQKEIYRVVLDCNKEIIKAIKPGVTLKELNTLATEILAKGLLNLGIIQNESEIKKYYFHSIGHHLGLDTHDPSDRDLPLVPGNVITDEPGVYIKELGIGIRIEDDILVTEDGSYNLSNSIIKEINDIEKALKFR